MSFRSKFLILAIFVIVPFACVAVPAYAQVTDAKVVNDWFLAKVTAEPSTRNSCIAHTSFAEGTKIQLDFYTSGALGGNLSFENEDWSSLNQVELGGGGKPDPIMALKVSFQGGEFSPIETDFRVRPRLVLSDGTVLRDKPGLSKFFEPDLFGALIISLAQSTMIVVTSGERTIGRWPLTGSKGAMIALLECARSVASDQQRQTENDPFRK